MLSRSSKKLEEETGGEEQISAKEERERSGFFYR